MAARVPTFEATPRTQRAWLIRRAMLQPGRKPSRWWVADRDLGGGKGVRRAKAQDTDSKRVTAVRQGARPDEPHSGALPVSEMDSPRKHRTPGVDSPRVGRPRPQ